MLKMNNISSSGGTFNDSLSFVIYLLQLKAFNHIMYDMITKLIIYIVIDLRISFND